MTIIDQKEFENDVLNGKGLCLVDFFASWCGPCKMLAPVLENVEKESGISVYKVDIDEERELAVQYKVMVVPTMYIFKNGEVVESFSGYMQKEEILGKLSKFM